MALKQRKYFNFASNRQPAKGGIKYPFLKLLGYHITADSIATSVGTPTGSVADIQDEYDGTTYSVQEAAGIPGFEIIIKFVNVPFFKFVRLIAAYEGSLTHSVIMQLYDFTNAVYQTKRVIPYLPNFSLTPGEFVVGRYETVIENPTDYISGSNETWMRIYHPTSGNASHDIHFLYASLF